MKKAIFFSIIIFFCISLPRPILAAFEDNASSVLAGRILKGGSFLSEFWYVDPTDFHRYDIGLGKVEYSKMKELAVVLKGVKLGGASLGDEKMLNGRFVVDDSKKLYYVSRSGDFFWDMSDEVNNPFLMEVLATSTCLLADIPTAKIVFNEKGEEVGRRWQYLGWWGKGNAKYIPAMSEPSVKSKRVGAYSVKNRLKILIAKKIDGKDWYQVDGGMHKGAWVEAKFVDPIPQPVPEKRPALLRRPVKDDEYWVDVDMTRYVLTMFKGQDPVFATYVSIGMDDSPTLPGSYSVTHKYKKTRMHGAPPTATHYYDLEDVPWTMYYFDSYALHGAYWQDEFGGKRSSGCTNLTIGDAKFIFDSLGPKGDAEKIRYSKTNLGSMVYNHY